VNGVPGAKIDAGQPLVVLEAMKMEHGLDLPFAVLVKAVHVKVGGQVAPNHLLVEFEPA
jgi:acetyl/propionyl-CoA carboxylase alpha subunit